MQTHFQRPNFRPSWQQIAPRFSGERECLASYLALETAEVLAGEKPANLLNLVKGPRRCGRNLHRAWVSQGAELLRGVGLHSVSMVDRENSVLLFLYCPDALGRLLAQPRVAAFLRKAGYASPSDPGTALEELRSRFAGNTFPHEIGVFLGYPLKDVAGFMGWVDLPCSGQGPWKFYGAPESSRRLADAFDQCRRRMARRLSRCRSPFDCLINERPGASGEKFFNLN